MPVERKIKMNEIEALTSQIKEMKQEIERLRSVIEIQNLMGRYETLLVPQTMDRVAPEIFALWMDDVSMEVSDRGVCTGPDGVTRLFAEFMGPQTGEPKMEDGSPDLRGAFYIHHLDTPMIEVAKDNQTAHAVFYSCGVETPFNRQTGVRQAKWCWGKYSVELIRGEIGWRVWHMHWFRNFMNDYHASWVEDYENDTKDTRSKDDYPFILPTTYHCPYDPNKEVLPVPRNPEPYETHKDSSWIYGDWLSRD